MPAIVTDLVSRTAFNYSRNMQGLTSLRNLSADVNDPLLWEMVQRLQVAPEAGIQLSAV